MRETSPDPRMPAGPARSETGETGAPATRPEVEPYVFRNLTTPERSVETAVAGAPSSPRGPAVFPPPPTTADRRPAPVLSPEATTDPRAPRPFSPPRIPPASASGPRVSRVAAPDSADAFQAPIDATNRTGTPSPQRPASPPAPEVRQAVRAYATPRPVAPRRSDAAAPAVPHDAWTPDVTADQVFQQHLAEAAEGLSRWASIGSTATAPTIDRVRSASESTPPDSPAPRMPVRGSRRHRHRSRPHPASGTPQRRLPTSSKLVIGLLAGAVAATLAIVGVAGVMLLTLRPATTDTAQLSTERGGLGTLPLPTSTPLTAVPTPTPGAQTPTAVPTPTPTPSATKKASPRPSLPAAPPAEPQPSASAGSSTPAPTQSASATPTPTASATSTPTPTPTPSPSTDAGTSGGTGGASGTDPGAGAGAGATP